MMTALRGELVDSDTCIAGDITVSGKAPGLMLCRALVDAGHDVDRALDVFRGSTLALHIRSIGEGASLTVREDDGPRLVTYRSPVGRVRQGAGATPPIAPNDRPATP